MSVIIVMKKTLNAFKIALASINVSVRMVFINRVGNALVNI